MLQLIRGIWLIDVFGLRVGEEIGVLWVPGFDSLNVDGVGCLFVYSWRKAEFGPFCEEVDLFGVKGICKVSDQVVCVFGFGGVLWLIGVFNVGCVPLVVGAGCVVTFLEFR